jgi:FSR family fosmidomycin resistance protein-like MFS transporter
MAGSITQDLAAPEVSAAEGFQTGKVVTIVGGHAVHDTYTAFLPPLLPKLIETLSLSNTAAGALSAFLQIPSLAQPFIGRLADRTTLRWMVVAAPAVTGTLMSLLGWAPVYAVLAVMLFFAGLSVAAFHAVAPVAVGRLSGKELGRGMGLFMVGGELGRTVGPLVVVSALGVLSLRYLAVLMVAGWVTTVVVYIQLRRVPMRPPQVRREIPWRTALGCMRRIMLLLGGAVVSRVLMTLAVTIYLPVYLTEEGLSLFFAGAALTIVEAAGIAGAFLGGWMSDRLGRRWVLWVGHLVSPVFLVAFVLAEGWVRVPILLGLGLTLLSIQPVYMAIVQEQFPDMRAFANGVYLSMTFVIRSVAVIGLGVIADAFGFTTAFMVGCVAMVAGVPFVRLLPDRAPSAA